MEKRNEPPRKPSEKRTTPFNPSMAWWLLAVVAVALVLFVYSQQDRAIHLSYDDFVRLVREGKVDVDLKDSAEPKLVHFSNPTDLLVSAQRVDGRVTRQENDSGDDKKYASAAGTPISFYVNKSEKDDDLRKMLDEAKTKFPGLKFDYPEGPSALKTVWVPYIAVALIIVVIFFVLAKKIGGAGSPMAFG